MRPWRWTPLSPNMRECPSDPFRQEGAQLPWPPCEAALLQLHSCYQNTMPFPMSTPWTTLSPQPGTPCPPGSLTLASVIPPQLKSPKGPAQKPPGRGGPSSPPSSPQFSLCPRPSRIPSNMAANSCMWHPPHLKCV